MCDGHHQEQTWIGESRFAKEKGVDLVGTAEWFNRHSPALIALRRELDDDNG